MFPVRVRALIVEWYRREPTMFFAWLPVFVLLSLLGIFIAYSYASDGYQEYRFNHRSPSEHLAFAKTACLGSSGEDAKGCSDWKRATRELDQIPPSVPEFGDARKLLVSIQQQRDAAQEAQRQADEQAKREQALLTHTEQQSREQMISNVQGESNDRHTCRRSANDKALVSFDRGQFWWDDDGRCAAWLKEQLQEEQNKRDSDADLSSYWSTTLRVDTDMDSFWLPDEERTCETYPDAEGRVAVVACNATGTHRDHNIPVKFWGGVNRNTISSWKCRREKSFGEDQFVCRAIS